MWLRNMQPHLRDGANTECGSKSCLVHCDILGESAKFLGFAPPQVGVGMTV